MGYKSIEQKREYQRLWMLARREQWIAQHGPCAWCGGLENLQVDHIDRYQKQLNLSQIWSLSPRNPKRVAELAKCQVLCEPCHKAKNDGESIKTHFHGSETSYRAGCHCNLCREAHRVRAENYRARTG